MTQTLVRFRPLLYILSLLLWFRKNPKEPTFIELMTQYCRLQLTYGYYSQEAEDFLKAHSDNQEFIDHINQAEILHRKRSICLGYPLEP